MPLSSRPRPCFLPALVLTGLVAFALVHGAHAQTDSAPSEGNVRIEYAEVLRVEPVQVSEDACPAPPAPPAPRAALAAPGGRSARNGNGAMLSLNAPRPRPSAAPATPQTGSDETAQTEIECLTDPDGEGAQQLFYDVDYILRGVKYRSRLPYDPGNRLQVQFSVTPLTSPESDPPPES